MKLYNTDITERKCRQMVKVFPKLLSLLAVPAVIFGACAGRAAVSEGNETIPLDELVEGGCYSSVCRISLGETVSIEGDGAWVNGRIISITKGGEFQIDGRLTDGMIYVDADGAVTLTFKGADITNTRGCALYIAGADSAVINLAEDTANCFTDGAEYAFDGESESAENDIPCAAVYSCSDIQITGGGTMNVKGNYKYGIYSGGDIVINGCTVDVNAKDDGIVAKGALRRETD